MYVFIRFPTFHDCKCDISSPPMILCFRMEVTLLWCAHFLTQTVWFHYKQKGLNTEQREQR